VTEIPSLPTMDAEMDVPLSLHGHPLQQRLVLPISPSISSQATETLGHSFKLSTPNGEVICDHGSDSDYENGSLEDNVFGM
jgi:hypothetical protein